MIIFVIKMKLPHLKTLLQNHEIDDSFAWKCILFLKWSHKSLLNTTVEMPLKALHLLLHLLIHLQYGTFLRYSKQWLNLLILHCNRWRFINLSGNAIIGGENIEISKFKHHARLVDVHTPNPVFASCGGTLVSYSHILTAADCLIGYVNYPKNIRVLLGGITGGDGMIFEIQKITIHPSYQSANDPGDNNLAIISVRTLYFIRNYFHINI